MIRVNVAYMSFDRNDYYNPGYLMLRLALNHRMSGGEKVQLIISGI